MAAAPGKVEVLASETRVVEGLLFRRYCALMLSMLTHGPTGAVGHIPSVVRRALYSGPDPRAKYGPSKQPLSESAARAVMHCSVRRDYGPGLPLAFDLGLNPNLSEPAGH